MKTFRTKDAANLRDLVIVLREMGYVAHRSGIASVDAYVRAPRSRARIMFRDQNGERSNGSLDARR